MEYMNRAIEAKLQQAIGTFKAVLLTGARQVGKSTVLKNIFPHRPYVTLDDPFWKNRPKAMAICS